jgi:hypothetical protein
VPSNTPQVIDDFDVSIVSEKNALYRLRVKSPTEGLYGFSRK